MLLLLTGAWGLVFFVLVLFMKQMSSAGQFFRKGNLKKGRDLYVVCAIIRRLAAILEYVFVLAIRK